MVQPIIGQKMFYSIILSVFFSHKIVGQTMNVIKLHLKQNTFAKVSFFLTVSSFIEIGNNRTY